MHADPFRVKSVDSRGLFNAPALEADFQFVTPSPGPLLRAPHAMRLERRVRSHRRSWYAGPLQAKKRRRPVSETEDVNARHNEKMRKKKAAREKILAGKTIEKGLLIVHTGKGKGKSTAAMGLAMRAMGHGMRVGIVQFVKGVWETGERDILNNFPDLVTIKAMGEGFTWDTQDRARDIAAAEKAWEAAKDMMADPANKMVILDELNIVLRYDYIPLADVVAALKARRKDLHVVVTGRNAKDDLIEAADLVTEMTQIKHPFRSGVKAQVGVEF